MELVKVYSAANELDAEMIKSILEDEGISAMISAETYGRLLGGTFGTSGIGDVRVLVRPEEAERAARIISEVRIEGDGSDEGLR
jgi:hypothetical protein